MTEWGSEELSPESEACVSRFFEKYDAFDKKRECQKEQGGNDYSLLRSVFRRLSDEVDLHSRFLCSMLDPSGPHFRRSAFGEAFMSVLGYPGWLDWATTRVRREHECIDLYMTDGKRHVLIENKIHAMDQPGQVRRYIDQVRGPSGPEQMPMEADDLLFVYLSNGRDGPTEKSLKPYELRSSPLETYVVDQAGQRVARFVNAHYLTHVLPWTAMCLASVKNVDNLRNAFSEYQGVVQRITRTYKSYVMSLEDFLLEDSRDLASRSRVRFAFEIAEMLPEIKANWLSKMFIDGLNDMLDEEVRDGRLVLIADDASKALRPLQFDRDHARLFFPKSGKRGVKGKGRFWRVATGPGRDAAALAVLFGSTHLHIGLLPIKRLSEGVEFNENTALHAFDLRSDGQVFEFKRHSGINGTFKGLVSWTVSLDTEIEHLANFEGSRVALVVKALIKHAFEGNASFPPATEVAIEGLPR
ncbi:hypothetical protein AWB75_02965 [Caballeronia catudaia]|uniref:PD-(D/E)XK nuclease superfamily protein n=1 Tax=Caballeronia catudaia TaxID=1777136 RepID=A0A158B462_9BURK|nr:PD-(D/E)XK nuclease family protein [Caballeronia catudaia]SAK64670.1 hypothetical protein AWB75_02965 [Caballeronia catudaia]